MKIAICFVMMLAAFAYLAVADTVPSAFLNLSAYDEQINFTCVEYWKCTEWDACSGEYQIRECRDFNHCGTEVSKPDESKKCGEVIIDDPAVKIVGEKVSESDEISTTVIIITAVVLGIIAFCLIFFLRKKK